MTFVPVNFSVAAGLHEAADRPLEGHPRPGRPDRPERIGVHAVTFALGTETVTMPAAVAVPFAVPVAPALSVSVTRSAA